MSEIITFPLPDGADYVIPDIGDENWGQNVTDFLVSIPNGVVPRSGTFTLTGDVSFGASFGLVSAYFKSGVVNPSSAGLVRMAKTDTIGWRNNANSGNNVLAVNSSDILTYNGVVIPTVSGVVTSITGTANQVIASASTGAVTLSLPQSIATTSLVQFAQVEVGTSSSSDGVITFANHTNANTAHLVSGITSPSSYSLTLPVALGTTGQVLTASDNTGTLGWTTPGAGTVSSVAMTVPSFLSVSGSPVTTTGTLAVTLSGTALPVANGGTGDTSFTAYSVLCGGTTSGGVLQNVSGVGSSGQALVSNGASALPTWQSIGGSGTVNSGTANNFAYYATSTNAVSDSGISFSAPAFAGTAQALTLRATQATNQLSFTGNGGGNQVRTINVAATTTVGEVITLPDIGVSSTVAYLEGTQTFSGTKTFSSVVTIPNGSAGTVGLKFANTTGGNTGLYSTADGNLLVSCGGTVTAGGQGSTNGAWVSRGTNTNDNASSGFVGEYIESVVGAVNFPATNTYGDCTSISLTAGDWNVTARIAVDSSGATWSRMDIGISTTSGNSATGLVYGSNRTANGWASSLATPTLVSSDIPVYRMSLSTTTTVYLKFLSLYTLGGPPQTLGAGLCARRVR